MHKDMSDRSTASAQLQSLRRENMRLAQENSSLRMELRALNQSQADANAVKDLREQLHQALSIVETLKRRLKKERGCWRLWLDAHDAQRCMAVTPAANEMRRSESRHICVSPDPSAETEIRETGRADGKSETETILNTDRSCAASSLQRQYVRAQPSPDDTGLRYNAVATVSTQNRTAPMPKHRAETGDHLDTQGAPCGSAPHQSHDTMRWKRRYDQEAEESPIRKSITRAEQKSRDLYWDVDFPTTQDVLQERELNRQRRELDRN